MSPGYDCRTGGRNAVSANLCGLYYGDLCNIVARDRCSVFADAGIRMPFLPCHNALCWLLSLLVFAGTRVPTVFEHSHADGDVPHEHRDSDCPLYHNDHHHNDHHHNDHHHNDHPDSPQPRFEFTNSESPHSHLSWFGIELHVPNSNGLSDDDSERQSSPETVVAKLGQPFTLIIQSDCVGDQARQSTAVVVGERYISVRQSIRSSAPVTFPPLCDAALRELTGVLRC